jgi:hypothetical protein
MRNANIVKHQPAPTASMIGCKAAVPPAAIEHLTILADAAAVEDLPGFKSVVRVPQAYVESAYTVLGGIK